MQAAYSTLKDSVVPTKGLIINDRLEITWHLKETRNQYCTGHRLKRHQKFRYNWENRNRSILLHILIIINPCTLIALMQFRDTGNSLLDSVMFTMTCIILDEDIQKKWYSQT